MSAPAASAQGALQELSVEEMNKLRASLGLAPLCVPAAGTESSRKPSSGPDQETLVDSTAPASAARQKEEDERDEDKARARHIRASRKSLGESILEEGGGKDEDVQEWIARMRRRDAEAPHDGDDAAAATVAPKHKKRRKEKQADKDKGENGNVRMAKHAQRLAAQLEEQDEAVLTLKDTNIIDETGTDVNDDDAVLESAEVAEQQRRIKAQQAARKAAAALSKYDDDEFEELRQDTAAQKPKAPAVTTTTTATSGGVAREYYTSEEMQALFKRKRRRTAQRAENKHSSALEDLLAEQDDEVSQQDSVKDTKSKEEREQETLDALKRMAAEQKQRDRALTKERKLALRLAHTGGAGDEEEDELYQSLARTRAAAQKRAVEQQKQQLQEQEQMAMVKKEPEAEPQVKQEPQDGVVIDDMSAFLGKIEARKAEAQAQAQAASKARAKAKQQEQKEEPSAAAAAKDDEEEDYDDDDEAFGCDRPLDSVSSVLAYLADQGGADLLARNSTVVVGRKQDGFIDLKDDPAPHLKLEYLDADGNQLRPKEAFRQMSYTFHGRKPHQKKKEKLARMKYEAQRVASMESTDTPLHAVEAMERVQRETGQAFVVLSGKGAQNTMLAFTKN